MVLTLARLNTPSALLFQLLDYGAILLVGSTPRPLFIGMLGTDEALRRLLVIETCLASALERCLQHVLQGSACTAQDNASIETAVANEFAV